MRKFLLAFAAVLLCGQAANSQRMVGCYLKSTTPMANFDINLCTHAYVAYSVVEDYASIVNADIFSRVLDLKQLNPNLKVFASLSRGPAGDFAATSADPTKLDFFIKYAVSVVQQNGIFDGIDIHWKYPDSRTSDPPNFVNMLRTLKAELAKENKLLSVFLVGGMDQVPQAYDKVSICSTVDIVNLMGFDMASFRYMTTELNTPIDMVDNAVLSYVSNGCEASKVALGLSTHGFSYSLQNPPQNGVNAPATNPTKIPYRDVCKKVGSMTTVWEKEVPYSFDSTTWISYDNPTSIAAKLKMASSRGLAGAVFYDLEMDDYDNSCGTGYFPLMRSVYSAWSNNFNVTPVVPETTEAPIWTMPSTEVPTPVPTIEIITNFPLITTTEVPTTVAPTTVAPATTRPYCSGSGMMSHPTDPRKYIFCYKNQAFVFTCSSGLFDSVLNKCAAPTATTTTTTTTQAPTTQVAIICSANGKFPHPTDPHKYYICLSGRAFVFSCIFTLYNPTLKTCDALTTTTTTTVAPTTIQSTFYCFRYATGYTPDPIDCNKYHYCQDGVATDFACPEGYAWYLDQCVPRSQVSWCTN